MANPARLTIRRKEHLAILHGAIRIINRANLIHQVPLLLTSASKIMCVLQFQCPFPPRLIRILLFLLLVLIRILLLIPVIPTAIRINLIPRTIPVTPFPVTRSDILPLTQRIFRHQYQVHSEILILRTLLAEHTAQLDTAIILNNTSWRSRQRNRIYLDKQS